MVEELVERGQRGGDGCALGCLGGVGGGELGGLGMRVFWAGGEGEKN